MFGSINKGANAYATVSMETGVAMASPHKLVVMLFDGALLSLVIAQKEMKLGNVAAKSKAISKAISIIEEGLRASLNKEAGGEIAQSLNALYQYITSRLLQANLQNNPGFISEAQQLLGDLREAWAQIDPEKHRASEPASRMMHPSGKPAAQYLQAYTA